MTSSWVVERAAEELRALETEHPNRHDRLKLELRAFISDSLRSHPSLLPTEASSPRCPCLPSACSAATQESSNLKRKRKEPKDRRVAAADATGQDLEEETRRKSARSSVDMALERAEQCLRKIRRVKEVLAHGY